MPSIPEFYRLLCRVFVLIILCSTFSAFAIGAPSVVINMPTSDEIVSPGSLELGGTVSGGEVSAIHLALFNRSRRHWFDLAAETYSPDAQWIPAVLGVDEGAGQPWMLQATLEAGDYRLLALAIDAAGNPVKNDAGRNDWKWVDFAVGTLLDTEAPEVIIEAPLEGTDLPAGLVQISGTALESGGTGFKSIVVAVRDRISGQWFDFETGLFAESFATAEATLDTPWLDETTWSFDVLLDAGLHEARVLGIDRVNNVPRDANGRAIWTRRAFSVGGQTEDMTAPTVAIVTPLADAVLVPGATTFEGLANDVDSSGVQRVTVSLYDHVAQQWRDITTGELSSIRSSTDATLGIAESGEGTWSLDVEVTAGSWSLWVTAQDQAGNFAEGWQRVAFVVTDPPPEPESEPWAGPPGPAPNIVMMLVDDLGYADLNATDMPRMHAILESRGAELPLYTMRNCAPTRAALMTGKLPERFGITGVDAPPRYRGIDPAEIMLAERLRAAGYATGAFGKWHLGFYSNQSPLANGFDEFVGFAHGYINNYGPTEDGSPYPDGTLGHDHHGGHDMQAAGQPLQTDRYATFLFSEAASDFIARHTGDGDDSPFFAYVPFNAPHGPYSAPKSYIEDLQQRFGITEAEVAELAMYEDEVLAIPAGSAIDASLRERLSELLYYASVRALDDAAADIFDALIASGELDETIVMFASDNGAGVGYQRHGDNGILRGGKGSAYEGGHRVANLVVWPAQYGEVPPARTGVWIGDLYETFMTAAGAPLVDPDRDLDGSDRLQALLEGSENRVRKDGGVHFTMHVAKEKKRKYKHTDAVWAIKDGDMKYIRRVVLDKHGDVESYSEELYDNAIDPGETSDLKRDAAYASRLATVRGHYVAAGGDEMIRAWKTTEIGYGWSGFDLPDEWGFATNPYTY